MDIDDTICTTLNGDYKNATPNQAVIEKMQQYRELGFEICLYTSRNMRTYENNIGKITANTLPVILDWLTKNQVPYDEIIVGKPWCGLDGFYVDDKAIRPSEFLEKSYEEIYTIINGGHGSL